MYRVALLVLLAFHCYTGADSRICVHKPPDHGQLKFGVKLDHTSRGQRIERSASQQVQAHTLRIHVEYDPSIDALSAAESSLIKELLPEATSFLSELLSVKQASSVVLLNRQCQGDHYVKLHDGHEYCIGGCAAQTHCGPVTVPEQHLQACYSCNQLQTQCGELSSYGSAGVGIRDTDFILYVSAVATIDCQGADMSAHASYCQLEAFMDRPIAGYINLCPHHLAKEISKHYTLLTTIQHEIIHALGFSAALYAFYRDSLGRPLTPRLVSGLPFFNETLGVYQWSENVIRSVTRRDWDVRQGQIEYTVNMIVTPKVVEEARAHFNCPTLEGLEVENHGGTGTEITHFEKRLLANEAMTGTHTHERIFSRLTLAVMEDTGWYVPNYERADPLHWGKNLGCNFAKKSCKFWMDTRQASSSSIQPYCNKISQEPYNLTCDVGRAAVALCNLHVYPTDLPPQYQYFTTLPGISLSNLPRLGGSSVFADYCPFYQQFTYHMGDGTSNIGTVCRDPDNFPGNHTNLGAEEYGPQSVCIDTPLPWKQQHCQTIQQQRASGAGCYKVICDYRGLIIVVEGIEHLCTHTNQVVNVNVVSSRYLHSGQLICPACEDVCGSTCPRSSGYQTTQVPIGGGQCPVLGSDAVGTCVEMCSSDRDCSQGEKCCSNGCGHTCQRVASNYQVPEVPCSSSIHLLPTQRIFIIPVIFALLNFLMSLHGAWCTET